LQILTDSQLSDYHPCVISIHRAVSRIRRDWRLWTSTPARDLPLSCNATDVSHSDVPTCSVEYQ
jgi:hypothetical protein